MIAGPAFRRHVEECVRRGVVLAGSGEIRIGDETFPIRAGDIIACPAGGHETAHQIINTESQELRYLAISTQQSPEIAEYPDTGRFGVLAEMAQNSNETVGCLCLSDEKRRA